MLESYEFYGDIFDVSIESDPLFGIFLDFQIPVYSFFLKHSKDIHRIRSPTV